jgi:hypothetical protein
MLNPEYEFNKIPERDTLKVSPIQPPKQSERFAGIPPIPIPI